MHEDVISPAVWVVEMNTEMKELDTRAAGREIHAWPSYELTASVPYNAPFRDDPFTRRIHCRRMLTSPDLDMIRDLFPGSVGVRVLTTG